MIPYGVAKILSMIKTIQMLIEKEQTLKWRVRNFYVSPYIMQLLALLLYLHLYFIYKINQTFFFSLL